jgi:hypothetical protein
LGFLAVGFRAKLAAIGEKTAENAGFPNLLGA